MSNRPGSLYLLHWSPPLVGGRNPSHYLGWTDRPVEDRVREHVTAGHRAAKIVVAAVEAGREVVVAATWPGDRREEARLKARNKSFARICPVCHGMAAGGSPVASLGLLRPGRGRGLPVASGHKGNPPVTLRAAGAPGSL